MTNDIGLRIKKLRSERKMSADQLGKLIGKSRATVYRYENGDIEDMPYTVLMPIAKALGTTPTYLMGVQNADITEHDNICDFGVSVAHKLEYWFKEVGTVDFTNDELNELITFAKFLLSKRK